MCVAPISNIAEVRLLTWIALSHHRVQGCHLVLVQPDCRQPIPLYCQWAESVIHHLLRARDEAQKGRAVLPTCRDLLLQRRATLGCRSVERGLV